MPKKLPKDPTSAKRTAALKARLHADGGKRMSINLIGDRVKKLDKLKKLGVGDNHTDVINRLIDDAEYE